MLTNRDVLARIPAFDPLPRASQEYLADHGKVLICPAQHTFYHQGDELDGLYALATGHAKLYRESAERTQILALMGPGDCFGSEALSENSISSCAAATLSNCTALFVPVTVMRQLLTDYPEFRMVLLQLVTERLRQFAALVHNLAFRDVTARLATVLEARAESDGVIVPEGIRIPRLMTQSELATMVGTAREVVQRTFKKLESAGVLQVSRREIVILDIERLRQIAEKETR